MKKILLISIILITSCSHPSPSTFAIQSWLDDFSQLKQSLSENYANLEWDIERRGLNVYQLNRDTLAKLRASRSGQESTQIIKDFLAAFHDYHLHIDQSKSDYDQKIITKADNGEKACLSMGGRAKTQDFPFSLAKTPDFNLISDSPYPMGVLKLRSKKIIGVLRIPSFRPFDYLNICVTEWDQYRTTFKSVCDDVCQKDFQTKLENRLLIELGKKIKIFEKKHIQGLLVDLTNNGGGTSWVEGVRDMLTPKMLTCGSTAFIRDDHWSNYFKKRQTELVTLISGEKKTEKRQDWIEEQNGIQGDFESASQPCDRSPLWEHADFHLTCSLVVKKPPHSCRLPDQYAAISKHYKKKLFILANKNTASASEDLVGRYKDNGAAIIIGARTMGLGCGYTDGGIKLILKNSQLRVRMPDCIRYLKDGTNELEGIQPDISLSMDQLNSSEFVDSLVDTLSQNL